MQYTWRPAFGVGEDSTHVLCAVNEPQTLDPNGDLFCATMGNDRRRRRIVSFVGVTSWLSLLKRFAWWARCFMPTSHRRHGQAKTVLSFLFLSCPCQRCEQTWWQVKTVGDWKFRNCLVQSRNVARTTENSLDVSPILFSLHYRQDKTRKDKTKQFFGPCRWYELGIVVHFFT